MKGGIGLFSTPDDMNEILAKKYLSNEWYIFFAGMFGSSSYIFRDIEQTYYKPGTPSNADFELIIGVVKFAIALAKKSRMTPTQLVEILKKYNNNTEVLNQIAGKSELEPKQPARDCIILGFKGEDLPNREAMIALTRFNDYLDRLQRR